MSPSGQRIPYTKAKTMKNRIDHRMAGIEKAVGEMLATVTDHSLAAEPALRDLRAIADNLKEIVDRRSEPRRG